MSLVCLLFTGINLKLYININIVVQTLFKSIVIKMHLNFNKKWNYHRYLNNQNRKTTVIKIFLFKIKHQSRIQKKNENVVQSLKSLLNYNIRPYGNLFSFFNYHCNKYKWNKIQIYINKSSCLMINENKRATYLIFI